MNKTLLCKLIAALGGAALSLSVAHAQVRYFDKPPTPEELRQALMRPAPATPAQSPAAAAGAAAPDTPVMRGIRWNDNSAASVQSGQEAIKADPVAVTRPPAAPSDTQQAAGPAAAVPINFDLGSAKVTQSSLAYIDAIAQVLQRDPSMKLVIEGHTDGSGQYNRNMMLSWDRAYTVFKLLVDRYGIDPVRLQPVGRGPLEPMQGVAPTDGVNRRVQFRISG